MDFLRKFGFFFLLLGVLSDFLTPYVLGLYYPELNQMKSVISVFGEVSSKKGVSYLVSGFRDFIHPVIACIVCCICKYISCVSYPSYSIYRFLWYR